MVIALTMSKRISTSLGKHHVTEHNYCIILDKRIQKMMSKMLKLSTRGLLSHKEPDERDKSVQGMPKENRAYRPHLVHRNKKFHK